MTPLPRVLVLAVAVAAGSAHAADEIPLDVARRALGEAIVSADQNRNIIRVGTRPVQALYGLCVANLITIDVSDPARPVAYDPSPVFRVKRRLGNGRRIEGPNDCADDRDVLTHYFPAPDFSTARDGALLLQEAVDAAKAQRARFRYTCRGRGGACQEGLAVLAGLDPFRIGQIERTPCSLRGGRPNCYRVTLFGEDNHYTVMLNGLVSYEEITGRPRSIRLRQVEVGPGPTY